ncbi:hypothetical protein BsWGS_01777 [Bradybaena similaris]
MYSSHIGLCHHNILHSDPYTKQVFSEKPLVVFRRDKNLRDILVHSRLPVHTPNPTGATKCSCRGCKTCRLVIQTPSVCFPKRTLTIRETFTCESRNLIYASSVKDAKRLMSGKPGEGLQTDSVSISRTLIMRLLSQYPFILTALITAA